MKIKGNITQSNIRKSGALCLRRLVSFARAAAYDEARLFKVGEGSYTTPNYVRSPSCRVSWLSCCISSFNCRVVSCHLIVVSCRVVMCAASYRSRYQDIPTCFCVGMFFRFIDDVGSQQWCFFYHNHVEKSTH